MLQLHISIFFLFLSGGLFAQTPCNLVVKGRVKDIHHEEGLEFATVQLEEIGKGATTDVNGNFLITDVCKGKYHFIISHFGCETKNYFIEITRDTTIDFTLEHHSTLLDEITINELKGKAGSSLYQYTITGSILQSLQGKDLSQIVSYIPGVNVLKTGSSLTKPIINGMYGNRISILNQGIPQEGQQWGNDHSPEIDPNTSQNISVVKGTAAVRYGINAMGGVIILDSNPINDDPHIHGRWSNFFNSNGRGIHSNISLEQKLKLLKYRFIAGIKSFGDKKAPQYYLTNTGSNEKSVAALFSNDESSKWNRKLYLSFFDTEIGILKGAQISNLTDLQFAIGRDVPFFTKNEFSREISVPRQKVNHFLIKQDNKFFFSDDKYLNLTFSFQNNLRKEFDARRGGRDSIPVLDMKLYNYWIDMVYNLRAGNNYHQIGIQEKFTNNANQDGTGILPLLPNYVQNNVGLFYFFNMGNTQSKFEVGTRIEHQAINTSTYVNGIIRDAKSGFNSVLSLGYIKNFNNRISAKFNATYLNRKPFVHELYSKGLHQGLASIEEGNPELQTEVSIKFIGDLKFKLNEHSQLSISSYYHLFDDYIYLMPLGMYRLTIRGAYPVFKYNQADAFLTGIDAMLHLQLSHEFETILKVAYIKAKEKQFNTPLPFISPVLVNLDLNYLVAKIGKLNDIKLNGNITYNGRQNDYENGLDYAPPPDAFTLINMGLSGKTKLFKKELSLYFGVENLLNSRYREYLNRLRYFAEEPGRNFNLKTFLTI